MGTGKDKLYIVQARPITVLPPEWTLPEKDVIYTRGSLAEHLPNPVTPLFATLGLEIVNRASALLWIDMFGKSAKSYCQKTEHIRLLTDMFIFPLIQSLF